MVKPTKPPDHVQRQLDRLQELTLRQVPIDPAKPNGTREPAFRRIRRRVELATANPSRLVSSRPDGFPSKVPGNGSPGSGKGGRPTLRIEDKTDPVVTHHTEFIEHPVTDDAGELVSVVVERRPFSMETEVALVPVSSVELAAMGRVGAVHLDDEVEQLALRIERDLAKAVRAIDGLVAALDRYEELRSTADVPDAPQCWVAEHHRLPWDDSWSPDKTTRFEGVLDPAWPEERRVCRWVYDFARKHKRIPTREECLQYLARGVVRVSTKDAS